jgi:hypothetical protein
MTLWGCRRARTIPVIPDGRCAASGMTGGNNYATPVQVSAPPPQSALAHAARIGRLLARHDRAQAYWAELREAFRPNGFVDRRQLAACGSALRPLDRVDVARAADGEDERGLAAGASSLADGATAYDGGEGLVARNLGFAEAYCRECVGAGFPETVGNEPPRTPRA